MDDGDQVTREHEEELELGLAWSKVQAKDPDGNAPALSRGLLVDSELELVAQTRNEAELNEKMASLFQRLFTVSPTTPHTSFRSSEIRPGFSHKSVATMRAMIDSDFVQGCLVADSWAKYEQLTCLIVDVLRGTPIQGHSRILIVAHAARVAHWKQSLEKNIDEDAPLRVVLQSTSNSETAQDCDVVVATFDDLQDEFRRHDPGGLAGDDEGSALFSDTYGAYQEPFRLVIVDEPAAAMNPDSVEYQALRHLNRDNMIIINSHIAEYPWEALYAVCSLLIPGIMALNDVRDLDAWKDFYGSTAATKKATQDANGQPAKGDMGVHLQRALALCTVCRPLTSIKDAAGGGVFEGVNWLAITLTEEERTISEKLREGMFMTTATIAEAALAACHPGLRVPASDTAAWYFKATNKVSTNYKPRSSPSIAPGSHERQSGDWLTALDTSDSSRLSMVWEILEAHHSKNKIVIFSGNPYMVQALAAYIRGQGVKASDVHSDLTMTQIEATTREFRDAENAIMCVEAQIVDLNLCHCGADLVVLTEVWFDELRSIEAIYWCLSSQDPRAMEVIQIYARNSLVEHILWSARRQNVETRRILRPLKRYPEELIVLTGTTETVFGAGIDHGDFQTENRNRPLGFPHFELPSNWSSGAEFKQAMHILLHDGKAKRRRPSNK